MELLAEHSDLLAYGITVLFVVHAIISLSEPGG